MNKLSLKNRPRNLNDVILCSQVHGDFYSFLREFLDEFYTEKNNEVRQQMLSIEPQLDANKQTNAYLEACNDPVKFCSGDNEGEITDEHRNERRHQALDS